MRKLIVCSIALFACSGGQSTPAQSASVAGIVLGASSALRVDAGSSSATTDASGHFMLLGLPAGAAALHFSGAGVNASLPIAALASGEHRQIAVTVSGNEVTENHDADETEFTGTISAIAAPNIIVAGRTIMITTTTEITRKGNAITLADLSVGDLVEVEGALAADGSVVAKKISLEDADDEQAPADGGVAPPAAGHDVEFTGLIASVAADGSSIVVAGITVTINANTEVEGALQAGEPVQVEGAAQPDGTVVATEIKVLAAEEASSVDVTGTITALDASAGTLTVGATALTVNGSTTFSGSGRTHGLSDFSVGDLVDAQVSAQADGSMLAIRIQRLEEVSGH
jgi:hypothetical protein